MPTDFGGSLRGDPPDQYRRHGRCQRYLAGGVFFGRGIGLRRGVSQKRQYVANRPCPFSDGLFKQDLCRSHVVRDRCTLDSLRTAVGSGGSLRHVSDQHVRNRARAADG